MQTAEFNPMNRTLSLSPRRHPLFGRRSHSKFLTQAQIKSDQQRAEAIEQPSPTFHQFLELPFELREQIWFAYLSYSTPRAYLLELNVREEESHVRSFRPPPPTDVNFTPTRKGHFSQMSDLVAFTAANRILGATCRESRAAVASLMPDSLQFKIFPNLARAKAHQPDITSGSIRFNARKDIVVLHNTTYRNIRQAARWCTSGGVVDAFATIQNLATATTCPDASDFDNAVPGKSWQRCHCGKSDCEICAEDALPQFLSCFPKLRTFHIAQITDTYPVNAFCGAEIVETVGPCMCAGDVRHKWPLYESMQNSALLISYDEKSECAFPVLPKLRDGRRKTGSDWPYYDVLGHLSIRILRKVDLEWKRRPTLEERRKRLDRIR